MCIYLYPCIISFGGGAREERAPSTPTASMFILNMCAVFDWFLGLGKWGTRNSSTPRDESCVPELLRDSRANWDFGTPLARRGRNRTHCRVTPTSQDSSRYVTKVCTTPRARRRGLQEAT